MAHLQGQKVRIDPRGPAKLVLRGEVDAVRSVARLLRNKPGFGAPIGAVICGGVKSKTIAGLPVLDSLRHAAAVAGARQIHVLDCDSDLCRGGAQQLLEAASDIGAQLFAVEVEADGLRLRPWGLRDVLPSSQSHADESILRAAFAGRRVLVTGAGGSIGSALCQHLASLSLAKIILLDSCEFNLFRIDHALRHHHSAVSYSAVLCDIRDGDAVRRQFERERPDIVLHAAALKHVPIVEAHACEGVLTNVAGTRNVALAARAVGADMVFVSTDKAVSPSSIMGATKRIGEMLCIAYDCEGEGRIIPVRLGNVLGSAGSVAPLFEHQIARGGPVTVTDAAVTRYFITIPRAAEFVLNAAAIGCGQKARRGAVHVLEMGAPVAVVDLAGMMIRLAGKRLGDDIAITFVGLRPGEKLSEQLIADDEWVDTALSTEITAVLGPRLDLRTLEREIERLINLARSGQDDLVRASLHRLVAISLKSAIAS